MTRDLACLEICDPQVKAANQIRFYKHESPLKKRLGIPIGHLRLQPIAPEAIPTYIQTSQSQKVDASHLGAKS